MEKRRGLRGLGLLQLYLDSTVGVLTGLYLLASSEEGCRRTEGLLTEQLAQGYTFATPPCGKANAKRSCMQEKPCKAGQKLCVAYLRAPHWPCVRWKGGGGPKSARKTGGVGSKKKGGGESKEEATKKGGNDLARCNTIFNCVYRWLLLHCSFQAPKSNWIGRQRQRNGERDSCSVGKRDGEMARERDGARRPTALA